MDRAVRTELTLQRRKNLAEQISDTLVEAIGLGVLKPSERIVEAEIAARFKVSRVPVREALKILVTQGILEGEPHKGLHVIAIDETMLDRILRGAACRGSYCGQNPDVCAGVDGTIRRKP